MIYVQYAYVHVMHAAACMKPRDRADTGEGQFSHSSCSVRLGVCVCGEMCWLYRWMLDKHIAGWQNHSSVTNIRAI